MMNMELLIFSQTLYVLFLQGQILYREMSNDRDRLLLVLFKLYLYNFQRLLLLNCFCICKCVYETKLILIIIIIIILRPQAFIGTCSRFDALFKNNFVCMRKYRSEYFYLDDFDEFFISILLMVRLDYWAIIFSVYNCPHMIAQSYIETRDRTFRRGIFRRGTLRRGTFCREDTSA